MEVEGQRSCSSAIQPQCLDSDDVFNLDLAQNRIFVIDGRPSGAFKQSHLLTARNIQLGQDPSSVEDAGGDKAAADRSLVAKFIEDQMFDNPPDMIKTVLVYGDSKSVQSVQRILKALCGGGIMAEYRFKELLLFPDYEQLLDTYPFLTTKKIYLPENVVYYPQLVRELGGGVYIGGYGQAKRREVFEHLRITHVVNITDKLPNTFEDDDLLEIKYLRLELEDYEDAARELKDAILAAMRFVEEALPSLRKQPNREPRSSPNKVLVHCHKGQSRSGSVIIALLMKHLRIGYDAALKCARNARGIIRPNPGFEHQLREMAAGLMAETHKSVAMKLEKGEDNESKEVASTSSSASKPMTTKMTTTKQMASKMQMDEEEIKVTALRRLMQVRKEKKRNGANDICLIAPDLYLSGIGGAYNRSALDAAGITHILTVAESIPPRFQGSFVYKRVALKDSPTAKSQLAKVLPECIQFIRKALERDDENHDDDKKKNKVLVHCFEGRSRSPAVLIAYLMQTKQMSLSESLALLNKAKRGGQVVGAAGGSAVNTNVQPNSGFMSILRSLDKL